MKNYTKNQGSTLVEMIAAIIILSIVLIGVMQFLFVSRLNIYTSNVRAGMMQTLKDTIIEYQYMPPGLTTNVPVKDASILTYLVPSIPHIAISKSAYPSNGTYTVSGELVWRAFPSGDGNEYQYTERLNLEIPQ